MENSRQFYLDKYAGDGNLEEIKNILNSGFSQFEIDSALSNAIAFSKIEIAEYLINIGANISWGNFEGVYFAVNNNEIEGLKYSISKGVKINFNHGMILNTSILTYINTNSIEITKWIIENGADVKLLSKNSIDLINKYGNDYLRGILINDISYSVTLPSEVYKNGILPK